MASQNNAERFIVAFATIERTLNAITRRPKYIPFRMNARISARYNTVVRNHLEEICSFAELRNCIVHTRDGKQKLVATPSDDTVEEIEHIAKLLLQDFNVLNFATAPVITGEYTEPLRDALTRMDEHSIDKLPVYSDGKFKGVFTLKQVLHHVLTHDRDKLGTVADVMNESMKNGVMFMSTKVNLEKVVEVFNDYKELKLMTPVIILTENGEIDEKPLGVITHQDASRITTFLM